MDFTETAEYRLLCPAILAGLWGVRGETKVSGWGHTHQIHNISTNSFKRRPKTYSTATAASRYQTHRGTHRSNKSTTGSSFHSLPLAPPSCPNELEHHTDCYDCWAAYNNNGFEHNNNNDTKQGFMEELNEKNTPNFYIIKDEVLAIHNMLTSSPQFEPTFHLDDIDDLQTENNLFGMDSLIMNFVKTQLSKDESKLSGIQQTNDGLGKTPLLVNSKQSNINEVSTFAENLRINRRLDHLKCPPTRQQPQQQRLDANRDLGTTITFNETKAAVCTFDDGHNQSNQDVRYETSPIQAKFTPNNNTRTATSNNGQQSFILESLKTLSPLFSSHTAYQNNNNFFSDVKEARSTLTEGLKMLHFHNADQFDGSPTNGDVTDFSFNSADVAAFQEHRRFRCADFENGLSWSADSDLSREMNGSEEYLEQQFNSNKIHKKHEILREKEDCSISQDNRSDLIVYQHNGENDDDDDENTDWHKDNGNYITLPSLVSEEESQYLLSVSLFPHTSHIPPNIIRFAIPASTTGKGLIRLVLQHSTTTENSLGKHCKDLIRFPCVTPSTQDSDSHCEGSSYSEPRLVLRPVENSRGDPDYDSPIIDENAIISEIGTAEVALCREDSEDLVDSVSDHASLELKTESQAFIDNDENAAKDYWNPTSAIAAAAAASRETSFDEMGLSATNLYSPDSCKRPRWHSEFRPSKQNSSFGRYYTDEGKPSNSITSSSVESFHKVTNEKSNGVVQENLASPPILTPSRWNYYRSEATIKKKNSIENWIPSSLFLPLKPLCILPHPISKNLTMRRRSSVTGVLRKTAFPTCLNNRRTSVIRSGKKKESYSNRSTRLLSNNNNKRGTTRRNTATPSRLNQKLSQDSITSNKSITQASNVVVAAQNVLGLASRDLSSTSLNNSRTPTDLLKVNNNKTNSIYDRRGSKQSHVSLVTNMSRGANTRTGGINRPATPPIKFKIDGLRDSSSSLRVSKPSLLKEPTRTFVILSPAAAADLTQVVDVESGHVVRVISQLIELSRDRSDMTVVEIPKSSRVFGLLSSLSKVKNISLFGDEKPALGSLYFESFFTGRRVPTDSPIQSLADTGSCLVVLKKNLQQKCLYRKQRLLNSSKYLSATDLTQDPLPLIQDILTDEAQTTSAAVTSYACDVCVTRVGGFKVSPENRLLLRCHLVVDGKRMYHTLETSSTGGVLQGGNGHRHHRNRHRSVIGDDPTFRTAFCTEIGKHNSDDRSLDLVSPDYIESRNYRINFFLPLNEKSLNTAINNTTHISTRTTTSEGVVDPCQYQNRKLSSSSSSSSSSLPSSNSPLSSHSCTRHPLRRSSTLLSFNSESAVSEPVSESESASSSPDGGAISSSSSQYLPFIYNLASIVIPPEVLLKDVVKVAVHSGDQSFVEATFFASNHVIQYAEIQYRNSNNDTSNKQQHFDSGVPSLLSLISMKNNTTTTTTLCKNEHNHHFDDSTITNLDRTIYQRPFTFNNNNNNNTNNPLRKSSLTKRQDWTLVTIQYYTESSFACAELAVKLTLLLGRQGK